MSAFQVLVFLALFLSIKNIVKPWGPVQETTPGRILGLPQSLPNAAGFKHKSPCGWLMAIPWCVTLSGCWAWLLRCSNYFLYGDIGLFRNTNHCQSILTFFCDALIGIKGNWSALKGFSNQCLDFDWHLAMIQGVLHGIWLSVRVYDGLKPRFRAELGRAPGRRSSKAGSTWISKGWVDLKLFPMVRCNSDIIQGLWFYYIPGYFSHLKIFPMLPISYLTTH